MTSSPVTLTIVNSGGVPSGVPGTPSITGANASDFAVLTNNCTAPIGPMGASCTMSVVFTPQTTAGEQATITVAAAPGGTAQATLSGMGLTQPALAITPDPGNSFAATTVGKASAPVTFTVKNSGQTSTTALQAPSFSGGNAGDFAVVAATDGCAGATLAANGGTCTFQVTVTPSVVGAESTTLAVQDGSGDSATDPLSATGLSKPSLGITPNPGNTFPTTTILRTSAPVTFTVTNGGQTASTALSVPTLSGGNSGDFAVVTGTDACSGASLAANGGTCTFQVTFTPSTTNPESTTLGVSDSGGDSATDTLSATGISATALSLSPNPGNTFQTTVQGQTSSPVLFTLTNSGQTTSGVINAPKFSSGYPGDFAVVSASDGCAGATLAKNATCTFQVTFTPSTTSTETTTLSVTDGASNSATDPLTATGMAGVAQLQVTPASYTFPATVAGTGTATNTFAIKNIGTGATTGFTVQNATAPFVQSNTCPVVLAAGASCSMTVTFGPGSPGPYSDTISIVDTATDTASLSLTGDGVSTTYYLIVSPDPGAFGMVPGGSSKTLPFTVTNYGQTALPGPINNVAFTGNYGPMFSSNFANSNCVGAALKELQSCNLTITFGPPVGSTGTVSGTTAAFLSATGGPYVSDPLTGSY
jgi:hypothetical protein